MGAMILYILLTSVGIVVVIAGPHDQPFVICEQPSDDRTLADSKKTIIKGPDSDSDSDSDSGLGLGSPGPTARYRLDLIIRIPCGPGEITQMHLYKTPPPLLTACCLLFLGRGGRGPSQEF